MERRPTAAFAYLTVWMVLALGGLLVAARPSLSRTVQVTTS